MSVLGEDKAALCGASAHAICKANTPTLRSEGFPLMHKGVIFFERLVLCYLPDLANHLHGCGVLPLSYLPNCWLSLFGKWLPLPAVIEAMDIFLEAGLRGVLAVTLALFQLQKRRLMAAPNMEALLELVNQEMRTLPIDGELLVKCARLWLPRVDDVIQETCVPPT
ncbi:TBC1D10C [Symbiodinium natans]|uniref:TBC1D10C protein n=1 Tax=Symbiodinium natans TaxID=878477 RepID=A0A812Q164_9DINO|nr:TBC1D10C [Symbiodinium natans]